MTVTIYHNPDCRTSRNTLAMIRQSGVEPEIIEYLKTPPSRDRLTELLAAMQMPARALLREKGTPYAELRLNEARWSDDELIDFMLEYPILINRPIVVTAKGTQAVPSFGSRARYSAKPSYRPFCEGRRRGHRRHLNGGEATLSVQAK